MLIRNSPKLRSSTDDDDYDYEHRCNLFFIHVDLFLIALCNISYIAYYVLLLEF